MEAINKSLTSDDEIVRLAKEAFIGVGQEMSKAERREAILNFEKALSEVEGATFGDSEQMPLKHSFSDGIYVREIFIPKGFVLTGKIHLKDHPNFLMSGKVEVYTEQDGYQILTAPMAIISKAGTKRVVKALEPTVWITCHNVGDVRDLKKIEGMVIAGTYAEYERSAKATYLSRILNKIKLFIGI